MRHLIAWIGLVLCLAASGLGWQPDLAGRALPVAAERAGEVHNAALWEREPVAATISDPNPVPSLAQQPARPTSTTQGGKPSRTIATGCCAARPAKAAQPGGTARAAAGRVLPHRASCATFIALRHIIR